MIITLSSVVSGTFGIPRIENQKDGHDYRELATVVSWGKEHYDGMFRGRESEEIVTE